jgi:hypothetical protein
MKANPKKFGPRVLYPKKPSPELQALDRRLGEVEETDPATERMAAWIKGWPHLRKTADDRYAEELQAILNREAGV